MELTSDDKTLMLNILDGIDLGSGIWVQIEEHLREGGYEDPEAATEALRTKLLA